MRHAACAADPDIDELRIEHHLAKTFLHRFHRRLGIDWALEGDRLDVDHRVGRAGHGLLQVADVAVGRQHQARVGSQWRQFAGRLPAQRWI